MPQFANDVVTQHKHQSFIMHHAAKSFILHYAVRL